MAGSWHYVKNGSRLGPVTLAELKVMLRSGEISADTNVWRVGMGAWAPLREVPEFASEASAVTPELPRTPGNVPPLPHPAEKPRKFLAGLRVMMIIGAVLAIGAFFAPYFLTNAKPTLSDHIVQQLPAADQEQFKEDTAKGVSTLVWGWSLWFGIVALIAAAVALAFSIVDLSMPRARVMRIVNQWILFAMFIVVFGVSAAGLTLGLCRVGLYVVDSKGTKATFAEMSDVSAKVKARGADIRKQIAAELARAERDDRLSAEQRAAYEKQLLEQHKPEEYDKTAVSFSVIPLAAPAAVVGGALGLLGAILIIAKKS